MQGFINRFSQLMADAGHTGNIFYSCKFEAAEPAEMRQQLLSPLGAKPTYIFKNRSFAGFCPFAAMPGDGLSLIHI